MKRRTILTLAAAAPLLGASTSVLGEGAARANGQAAPKPLERFIATYLRTMNAPGLTLGLTTREAPVAAAAYGYADLAAKRAARATDLFQIGSISKSFAGLIVLQLQDEGKLDVQHPILKYLPWLPIELDYGDITIHHLLTHSSGMPNQGPLFPAEKGARLRQGIEPGKLFHYSNWGYGVLGRLVETLDKCSWATAVERRLFAPLGMNASTATIDNASRARIIQSYQPLYDDRPYPRNGPLVPAGNMTFMSASGCISSTPADMNRYMQMLLNRGAGPHGRVLSEKSFELFATAHIDASDEVGPGVSYGYGLLVEQSEGHKLLWHTGGMVSFASSMRLDLDAGVGAFASINSMQDYRPQAVARYGLRLLQSRTAQAPALDEWPAVKNAQDYVGVYQSPTGRSLEVKAAGEQLTLWSNGARIPLQHRSGDSFIADHPDFAQFMIQFGREDAAVVELNHGADGYAHSRFKGERIVDARPELTPYEGYYVPDDPSLLGPLHIVQRRGRLYMNGTQPLQPLGGSRFRIADEPGNTEILEFRAVVANRAEILNWSEQILRKV